MKTMGARMEQDSHIIEQLRNRQRPRPHHYTFAHVALAGHALGEVYMTAILLQPRQFRHPVADQGRMEARYVTLERGFLEGEGRTVLAEWARTDETIQHLN